MFQPKRRAKRVTIFVALAHSRLRVLNMIFARILLPLALSVLPPALAMAQQGTLATKSDPRQAAAQTAFEALTEENRRTIQNDLVWATDYYGAALGTFGKLTFEAISAFQLQLKQKPDGILDAGQQRQLAAVAQKRRDAVDFKRVIDANTGSALGLMNRASVKQEKTAQGTKWTIEGAYTVETVKTPPDRADLAATFDRFVAANVVGRKVTYKLLRTDFFVVSGDTNGLKFYTRFAQTPNGLRGYTLTYNPAFSPDADRYAIALANSFEPVANGEPAQAVASGQISMDPPKAVPAALKTSATALLIGKGFALTPSSAVIKCQSFTIGQKPAQKIKDDPAHGLMLVKTSLVAAALPGFAPKGNPRTGVAIGFGPSGLLVAPVQIRAATVTGALQGGMLGSAVFDSAGNLVGLVADSPESRTQMATTMA
eukprot:gene6567-6636_t